MLLHCRYNLAGRYLPFAVGSDSLDASRIIWALATIDLQALVHLQGTEQVSTLLGVSLLASLLDALLRRWRLECRCSVGDCVLTLPIWGVWHATHRSLASW